MPATRRRRIVRRAVMAIAGVVLFLSVYVSAYCGTYWLRGKRVVGEDQLKTLNATVFWPIEVYGLDDWPGGRSIRILAHWCMFRGNGTPFTWAEVDNLLAKNE